jgi:outer membrane protein assembly factor BamB
LEGGNAGLAIADGRVFTLAADEQGGDVAVALSADDGRELWRVPLDPAPEGTDGPDSTPAVRGPLVYTLSRACRLRALEVATGKATWQRDLIADFGVAARRGCATSPLLEGDRLILQAGGKDDHRVVALNPLTGANVWSSKGVERTSQASVVVADLASVRQVVAHQVRVASDQVSGLVGLRLSDGAVLWSTLLEKNVSRETPLVLPEDRVLLLTWNDAHAFALAREGAALVPRLLWSSRDLIAHVSPPVYHQGHLYGFGGDNLACVEAATGKTVWKEKLYAGSLILVDGHLLALSNVAGSLRVIEATPAGYREKVRAEVLTRGARTETPPSFARGRVFVRNEEEVAAVEVGGVPQG